MPILLLAAQVVLSVTFLVSGVAKATDRRGTTDAMLSLRLPVRAAHPSISTLLPVVEIVLALGVWLPLPVAPTVLGALALALLLAYWGIIARALSFGEAVSCSCFGTLGSPTVSGVTLARNSLLVVLGILALAGASLDVPATALTTAPWPLLQVIVALLVAGALALLTLGGARQTPSTEPRGGARPATEGPTGATDADELDYERTPTPFGMLQRDGEDPISLATLTQQRAALLIWVRPGCGPCERVLSAVPAWREALDGTLTIRTLFRTRASQLAETVRERAGETAAWDIEGNLAASLHAGSSPAAVLLGADGQLAGGPVGGAEEVTDLVDQIIQQIGQAHGEGDVPDAGASATPTTP